MHIGNDDGQGKIKCLTNCDLQNTSPSSEDGEVKKKISVQISIILSLLCLCVSPIFAEEKDIVDNLFFSITVPDSLTYTESLDTDESRTTGYGLLNTIHLTSIEFSDLLMIEDVETGQASINFVSVRYLY